MIAKLLTLIKTRIEEKKKEAEKLRLQTGENIPKWKILLSYIIYYLYDRILVYFIGGNYKPKIKNNRLFFETMDDFSDNGRIFFEYLIDNGYNEKYEIVWSVKDYKRFKNKNIKNVKFIKKYRWKSMGITWKARYYSSSSKFLFFTTALNWTMYKRPGQVYINLWHGCGYKANKGHRKVYFDYCLVPGNLFVETKSDFFDCTKNKLLPMGYPRYDYLINESTKAKLYIEGIRLKYNVNKVVAWMPTYRKAISDRLNEDTLDSKFDLPIIDSISKLKELDRYLQDTKTLLMLKPHSLQKSYDFGSINLKNIIILTNELLDQYDVLLYQWLSQVDALITDYSSVAIDFLLKNKPIAFTLDDFSEYTASRGWVFNDPRYYMPGNHIYNFNEFMSFFAQLHIGKDIYKEKREKITKEIFKSKIFGERSPYEINYCQELVKYLNL